MASTQPALLPIQPGLLQQQQEAQASMQVSCTTGSAPSTAAANSNMQYTCNAPLGSTSWCSTARQPVTLPLPSLMGRSSQLPKKRDSRSCRQQQMSQQEDSESEAGLRKVATAGPAGGDGK